MRKFFLTLSAILCLLISAMSQRTITGKVFNSDGTPLQGATVEASDKSATVTSEDGSYKLKVGAGARYLLFTLSEYASEQLAIGTKTVLNVSLTSNQKNLQEVVVVGYGTQKRKEITGSLASVKGSDVASKPIQSFEQALAGRAAGVQITIPNGVLNTPPVFRIRGTNSISLSSYPLIVVDGVPSFTGDFSSTSSAGNALASINPNDIESIDIAKDAAATAIYGSRAANGVVYITTKKGKPGKARISYNGSVGWTNVYGIPKELDAFQYTDYKNLAASNNGGVNSSNPTGSGYVHFALTNGPDGQPINTNWADVVYRKGITQDHNVNVSGGSESTSYYFSAGYTNQQGILRKNDFVRKNVLFNIDSKPNKYFNIGGKISFSNEKNLAANPSGSLSGEAFGTAGLGRTVVVNSPNVSPYNNDGSYNISGSNVVGPMSNSIAQVGFYNPVVAFDLNRQNSETNHIQSNVYIQVKPLKWVTLRTSYGIDYILVDNDIFQNPIHGDGASATGTATSTFAKYKRYVWTNTAQFDYTFASKHTVSLLAGNEQQRGTNVGFGLNRTGLSDPANIVIQGGFINNNPSGAALGENYLLSYFGRLKYDFNKKYFVEGNLRQDEASQLGIKKGTFWGVSGGWEIANEGFWQSAGMNSIFNSFRLKGSYGKVGNISGIGDFATYSTFGSGLYGGNPTLSFNQAGNPVLQWESSTKTDVGFVFSSLGNRLSGEVEYYKNNIDHLILNVPQSPSAGLPTSVPTNVGTMYNKGIELTLNATPIQNKKFSWNTSFNFTTNKNMVTALAPGLKEIQTATSTLETVNKTLPEYSLGYLFVVRSNGVDAATGKRIFINSQGKEVLYQFFAPAGEFNWTNRDGTKYVSPTGGTAITQAADGVLYANTDPKQYGGWNNTFRYGNFELSALLTYQMGFNIYYGSNAGLHDQRFWNNAVDVLNHWSKPGDVTNIPKPLYLDNVSNGSAIAMDINVFKGDFVKLKNVSLAYDLPKNFIGKAHISSARFYISGQNLAIKTKYPGPDPEVSSNGNGNNSQGVDRNTIGNARTFTLGVNIGF